MGQLEKNKMTRRKIIPYNPRLVTLTKALRKNMTLSEILLWEVLKNRQKPIDEFIVDFYCKDLMLAIEIDGDSHNSEEAFVKDMKRQKRLEALGVRFLRFDDFEVKKDMNNVIRTIENWIEKYGELAPNPSGEVNNVK